MTTNARFSRQRTVWVGAAGVASGLLWLVGLGTGWRAWILTPATRGLVAHAQAFGEAAAPWWTPASMWVLTTAVLATGLGILGHLADAPRRARRPGDVADDGAPTVAGDGVAGDGVAGDGVAALAGSGISAVDGDRPAMSHGVGRDTGPPVTRSGARPVQGDQDRNAAG